MAPVWLWTPMALLVPLLTCWRSRGCAIPMLREPVVLQTSSIAPAYTQGLQGLWERGKKCVNEGRGEEEDESQPSSCWHASPHPFLQLSGAQLHSLATGPTSASPSPIWLRTN